MVLFVVLVVGASLIAAQITVSTGGSISRAPRALVVQTVLLFVLNFVAAGVAALALQRVWQWAVPIVSLSVFLAAAWGFSDSYTAGFWSIVNVFVVLVLSIVAAIPTLIGVVAGRGLAVYSITYRRRSRIVTE
jgi:hypothetical protein